MTTESIMAQIEREFPTMDHSRRVALFSGFLSLFGPYTRDNGQFLIDIYLTIEKFSEI